MNTLRYIRYLLSIVLTVFILLHIANVVPIPLLHTLENLTYDGRLKLMPPLAGDRKVVIIDIDEKSLATLGHWPWNRKILADLVDTLFEHYHIRVVGFDMVFAEADEDEAAGLLRQMADGPLKNDRAFLNEYSRALNSLQRDQRFAQSLDKRNTVLGFVMDTDARTGVLPDPIAIPDKEVLMRIPLVQPNGYTANLEMLQASALSAGFFDNPLLDSDGVYRRAAVLQQHENTLQASLALALTRVMLGSPKLELVFTPGADADDPLLLEWLKIGELFVPVDEQAGVLVPYIGKQKSFTYVSALDILEKITPIDHLRGKIALLGSSAPGLHDLRTTPLEAASPGVEIHANLIQGMLDRNIMHRPGYSSALEFILVLALGLGLTFLLPLHSPLRGMLVSAVLLTFLIGGSLAAWYTYQQVMPLAASLLLVIALFTLHMSYGFFVENRSRRKLANLFGQYVPPALVDEISEKMEDVQLDGEIRDMTVLFSDVRSFTTMSERMAPQQLTMLMNGFLTPITEVIHLHRGTIDKYLGDGVMAFWGAPLRDSRHALHALTAAMNIISRLHALTPEFAANGWPEINVGIGINSGEMNVGNKGSAFRVDYTVLGDAVNLGSRLEKLTKAYGVDIIVGENTQQAVPEFTFRELDRVRVRGRDRPVTIYEPLGTIDAISVSDQRSLARFHFALEQYRECHWDDAEDEIRSLIDADPQRKIYRIYLERIEKFRRQPPPDDWDGSYSHEST